MGELTDRRFQIEVVAVLRTKSNSGVLEASTLDIWLDYYEWGTVRLQVPISRSFETLNEYIREEVDYCIEDAGGAAVKMYWTRKAIQDLWRAWS